MFFDRLFLRVTLALFCSMFCASEMQAVPPGQDLPTPNTSTKRNVSESRRLPQGYSGSSSAILSTPGIFSSQTLTLGTTPAKENHESESKRQKTVEDISEEDAAFFAAVDAAEEEYYRSHPRPISLTPQISDQQDLSLFTPSTPSIGGEGEEEKESQVEIDFWQTVIAAADVAEEEYSQRLQSQTSLALSSSSQDSAPSQQIPSIPLLGTQSTEVSPYNTTPEEDAALLAAVIAAEERYSQGQASQSSSSPIAYEQESHASQTPGFTSPASESDLDEDSEGHFEGVRYWHLTTPQDHQQYLIDAINSAERSILITSYSLSADMTGRSDLFRAMQSACYRGVHIYLYANEIRLGDRQLDRLERLRNLSFSEAKIHSKLVVVDNKQITCGSYNWLAEPWRGKSLDASLILESSDLIPEADNIWHVLKKYRTIDFNPHSLRRVENTLKSLGQSEIPFDNLEDSVSILNTPYQHGDLFEACFEQAQRQLTICAPFISTYPGFLQNILPRNMLRSFLNSGKKLNIFCREGDDKIQLLKNHLNQILSGSYSRLWRNVTLTSVKGLHRKTMFADDDLYIEGSYNWLSSARSLKDPYYYMETSLQFRGTWARELIQEFSFPDEF